jgi:signal transduction histidine kinase
MDSNLIIQSYNDILLKEYKIIAGFKLKIGHNFRELLHANRKEKFNWVFEKITKEKKSFAYETTYTQGAKLNYFEITAIPVINNHEIIGYCIAAQNITKRKEMENVNKETNTILMRRNNDLEQFAFIVSHNLRAPVANIVALNTLLKESNDPIEKEEILDNIDISTERLENVIVDLNEILKVKKNVSELNEYINFKDVLQQASETLNKQIETSKIQITSNFTNCESTESIRVYFNSIFYNLISNSIKYAKNNIVPELHVWSKIDQDHIYLHFKDNGLGIDLVKFGTQLFGLYKRFNNTSEGNGIGLYMVKTQLESMGGHIFAKSQPNEGTEFIITLPHPNQENTL